MRCRQSYAAAPLSGDFVYVIEGRDAVKVGVTRNLGERLATLQTGSPHPLTLAYHLPIAGDAFAVEAEAHAILQRHRVGGEWFGVAPDIAVAAVSAAAYRLGVSTPQHAGASRWTGWQRRVGLLAGYSGLCVAAGVYLAPPIGIALFSAAMIVLLLDLYLRHTKRAA